MTGRKFVTFVLLVLLLAAGHLEPVRCQSTALSTTFYATSCPNVNQIVRDSVGASMNSSAIVGPGVLRLFAHDCFVTGCDASILLQDTSPTDHAERDFSDNLTLQQLAFDAITSAKAAVEAQCPGIVSCADILVMAGEDVVNMMGGPSWSVLLGRRDGLHSTEASVVGHLPGADMDVTQMMAIFTSIGLTTTDLVVLSGAHSVGFAHCSSFMDRLYNFNNVTNTTDPSLAPAYLTTLQALCPQGNFSNSTVQALDPNSPGSFDNAYYQELQVGHGLLFSDQTLFVDNTTTNAVTTYANNQVQFFTDFVTSMIAMSQIQVLTGTQGEIRLNCAVVNSGNSTAPSNSTTPPPPSNSTAPPPPSNSTTPPPPSNSTTPPPPSNSTTPPPPSNATTPAPPSNSTTPAPPSNSTIPAPPANSTTPPPPSNSTTPPPAPVALTPTSVVVPPSPPPPAVTPASPPAPVVTPSPPPVSVVTQSPHTAPVIPPPPPAPVVAASPPPPVVTPSPPAAPVVTPPSPVVTASPPPAAVTPASPRNVPKATPPPPPHIPEVPPTVGRRRA